MTSYVQTDFRGGMWSPSAQGRMDDLEYKRSLNECLNGYPLEDASWVRRPPFRAIGYTRFGAPARLLSLAGFTRAAYNIELTDGHLRFSHGAQFVVDATTQTVTNITALNPTTITTLAPHGWNTGDQAIFNVPLAGEQLLVSPLLSRVFKIEVTSPTAFKLHELLTDAGIDGAGINWVASLTILVSRVLDVSSPYTDSTWRTVKRVQTDEDVVLLHAAFWPRTLKYTEAGDAAWANVTLTPSLFKDGPYLDPQDGSVATPDALTGLVNLTFSFAAYDATTAYAAGNYVTSGGFHWTSLQDQNINHAPADGSAYWQRCSALAFLPQKSFSASDVGRHVRMLSEPAEWLAATTYADGAKVKHNNTYWMCIAGGTVGAGAKEPGSGTTYWVPYAAGARWTWGKIVSIGGGTKLTTSDGPAFGDMTAKGGLASLFNGGTLTATATSAQHVGSTGYAGLNLASPAAIASAKLWPSRNPAGVASTGGSSVGGSAGTYTFAAGEKASVTINLRGKNSLPASASDGTLLGTSGNIAYTSITGAPISIASTDGTSTWTYIWFEIIVSPVAHPITLTTAVVASEAEFYTSAIHGNTVQVQLLGKALLYVAGINTWRLGRYNDTDPVYPTSGCYYEGRLILGAGKSHFDTSKSNDPFNFAPTEDDGTVTDASAISYTFNSPGKSPILWMHPSDNGIIMGTPVGERLVFAPTQGPLSATNITDEVRTHYGSADVEPVQTPITVPFVSANGISLHEYMRDAYSARMTAPSLTDYVKSLTSTGIVQIAYQAGLTPLLWGVTEDNRLIGSLYARENLLSERPPKFNGWHHHEHGQASRKFMSVSISPSISGVAEVLTVVTEDQETGLNRIEVAADLMPEGNDVYDCNFLDGMYVPPSGGTYLINGDSPDGSSGDVTPPPPPPPPDPADPFSCLGALSPGFYRSETDGISVVPRTDPHAYVNGYGNYSSVLYNYNVGSIGPAVGKYFAVGWVSHPGDTAGAIDLAGNTIVDSLNGVVTIWVITAVWGGTLVVARCVERWDTCLGSAPNYSSLSPKPTWPNAP